MLSYIQGDVTSINTPVIIAHCVNNIGHWGRGFSGVLSKKWKNVETEYRLWHSNGVHPEDGRFGLGRVLFSVAYDCGPTVASMVAQAGTIDNPRGWLPPIRYGALTCAMTRVAKYARDSKMSICCPRFGCGLAGGQWAVVENMIKELWSDIDVTVYESPI